MLPLRCQFVPEEVCFFDEGDLFGAGLLLQLCFAGGHAEIVAAPGGSRFLAALGMTDRKAKARAKAKAKARARARAKAKARATATVADQGLGWLLRISLPPDWVRT